MVRTFLFEDSLMTVEMIALILIMIVISSCILLLKKFISECNLLLVEIVLKRTISTIIRNEQI